MTRLVIYLLDEAREHTEHAISVGYSLPHAAAGDTGMVETEDAGIALPVGAEYRSASCVECGLDLEIGEHIRIERVPEHDIVPREDPWDESTREPWEGDNEAWRG